MTDQNFGNQEKPENNYAPESNQPEQNQEYMGGQSSASEHYTEPEQPVSQNIEQQGYQKEYNYQKQYENYQQQNDQQQGGFQQQTYYQGQGGYQQNMPPQQDMPENYMILSIVATVLGFICCSSCCVGGILGIIAIVFSSQVSTKFMGGDIAGAVNSAKTAKTLGIVSLVITILGMVATIGYYIFLFASGGFDVFMEDYQQILNQLNY